MTFKISLDGMLFAKAHNLPPEQLIDIAVDSGADGVQWPWSLKEFNQKETRAFHQEMVSRGLSTFGVWMTQHLSAHPFVEEKFLCEIDQCIELSEIMGSSLIECWPVRKYFFNCSLPLFAGKRFLQKNLFKVANTLIERKIKIAIEFHPNAVLRNYGEILKFLEGMPPVFVITLDTYHSNNVGDAPSALFLNGTEKIELIHLSGSHRQRLASEGDVFDYREIIRNAIHKGFKGNFVIQYRESPKNFMTIADVVKNIRSIVNDAQKNKIN